MALISYVRFLPPPLPSSFFISSPSLSLPFSYFILFIFLFIFLNLCFRGYGGSLQVFEGVGPQMELFTYLNNSNQMVCRGGVIEENEERMRRD